MHRIHWDVYKLRYLVEIHDHSQAAWQGTYCVVADILEVSYCRVGSRGEPKGIVRDAPGGMAAVSSVDRGD